MFVPSSTKRPHWVLLGLEKTLKRPGMIQSHVVLGRRMVSFVDGSGEMHVAEEACPHRGASLALGTQADRCIVCPFHAQQVSASTHLDRFYDYAALQGFVWLDVASKLITQHFMPPYYPELSSSEYETYEESYASVHINALVVMEHLLDRREFGGASTVERVGPYGLQRHLVDSPHGQLVVDCEYHVPFTASLKFSIGGKTVLLAVFSVLPVSPRQSEVFVRLARLRDAPSKAYVTELAGGSARAHEVRVLRSVDVGQWASNRLGPSDELIKAYRDALHRFYPDIVEYLARHA